MKGKKLKKKENWRGETHYQTTPEKSDNSTFTLKTHRVVHTKPEKFEKAKITDHSQFYLCLRRTWTGKSHCSRDVIVFKEFRFQFFSFFFSFFFMFTLNHNATVFKFVRFEERKAPFSICDKLM